MKILVDENIPFANETFGQHGELIRYPGRLLEPDDLVGVDALITRSITKVNAELFSKNNPDFVGTCTIGTDHLDIPFLESSGISWASAPGCNAQSVVDYVLSVIAALKDDQLPNTVGIVGCGNVGGLLRKMMLSLGLDVRVHDPFLSVDEIPELCSLEQVFQSEMVCLHTPYTATGEHPTREMVGREQLIKLPLNALLVSAGRGGVIREMDLLPFMKERADVQVALDVWESEPCINSELLESVAIATPHIAGYSIEGKRRGTIQVYKAFCEHFSFLQNTPEERHSIEMVQQGNQYFTHVLAAYNPKLDMYRMRNSFSLANETVRSKGIWFDELRRSYPERHEIKSFRLEASTVSNDLKAGLEKRGFKLF